MAKRKKKIKKTKGVKGEEVVRAGGAAKELEECQRLKNEYLTSWQRARADLINYKKEEVERFKGFLERAGELFVLELLPILDNFDEASKNISDGSKKDENIKGLLQIKKQFKDFLREKGLEEIKTLNQKFDPALHEAVEEIETKNEQRGTILEVIRKGYKLNNKVIRPAKVRVVK